MTERDAFARHTRPGLARLLSALSLDVVYRAGEGDRLRIESASSSSGTEVLDLVGGFGASLFGHNHPVLLATAEASLRRRAPFNAQGSVRGGAARLAARLSSLVGNDTGHQYVVTLGSTGSEAVEAAITHATVAHARQLAQLHQLLERDLRQARDEGRTSTKVATSTGEVHTVEEVLTRSISRVVQCRGEDPKFVSLRGAFHGKTTGALALTDQPDAPTDLRVRGPRRLVLEPSWTPSKVLTALDDERVLVDAVTLDPSGIPRCETQQLSSIAACFVEPIQGEAGVRELPVDTMQALRQLADRHGAPLVIDEIQTGMGRTGTFLASTPTGVAADYYLLSKALGGGMTKISALLVEADQYVDDLGHYHTSTYADDDYSCEVALAALDLLTDDKDSLQKQIATIGRRLKSVLERLASRWPDVIVDVRGRGLMLGVELAPRDDESGLVGAVANRDHLGYVVAGHLLHTHAIRVLPTLSAPMTLRIEPSAYLSQADIDRLEEGFASTVALLHRRSWSELLAHLSIPVSTPWQPPASRRVRPPVSASDKTYDRGRRIVAFLANLNTPADVRAIGSELASWTDAQCAALLGRVQGAVDPFEVTRQQVSSPSGEAVEVCMVAVPFSASQAVEHQRLGRGGCLCDLVLDAVDLAVRNGASVIGLGGYTSIVTGAGRAALRDGVIVTSGNSLTVASVYETLRHELARRPPNRRHVGVVGALGNIGEVLAQLLLPYASAMTLVGRPGSGPRLQRLADLLAVASEVGPPKAVEDIDALGDCDVVVTATNAASPIIDAVSCPTGQDRLICDLAVPGDVHPAVGDTPGVLLSRGGRVRLPLGQLPMFPGMEELPEGTVYACLAETILLGFELGKARPSNGSLTVGGVKAAAAMAARHDFRAVLVPLHRGGPQ